MAKWVNEKKLSSLGASLRGNVITFSAGKEKAEVYLKGSDIAKVIYRHAGTKTVIQNKDSHRIVVGEKNWQRDVYHYLKPGGPARSEEHTSELQSHVNLVCRLL